MDKLRAVFHAPVLLLTIMNVVMTLSTSCFDNAMMKFIVNNRTDAFNTLSCLFFTITIVCFHFADQGSRYVFKVGCQ